MMTRLLTGIRSGLKTPRYWAVLLVWVASLFYVLFQGGKTSLMLFVMISVIVLYLIVLGISGVRLTRGTRQLSTERGQGTVLHAGEQIKVRLHFSIPGFLPMPYIIIREVMKRHNGDSWSFEESVIPNYRGSGTLMFQTPPLERGRYYFTETECVSEDIFGFIEHKGRFHVPGQFRVMPRTVFIPTWKLFDRNSPLAGPQTASAASRKETTQINGVRDYVYGDRISRIHWNATAKTGQWKSKEFEYDSVPKTMLLLDATKAHYGSDAQFELAVSTAASLLEYGGRGRMNMGLATLGDVFKLFPPSSVQGDRQRMMHHLVDLSADGYGKLLPKLEQNARFLPAGAFLVFISPASGQQVLDILRWAETRGMSSSHIRISSGREKGVEGWGAMLASRGTFACSIQSLSELPAALGGGRV
ncbi:uncharacterized protein (DUF58 family) [Paenibacillus favisporus]|uniref:Uncharacterized protein (DUF58 family) n=2 Tax=Paenibacillus favisporus TaxID=221028 RepID=A0ABV2EWA5_9BACL